MTEAERQRYANSGPCEECGLPIAACNQIAMLRDALRDMVRCFDPAALDRPPQSEVVRRRLERAREVLAELGAYQQTTKTLFVDEDIEFPKEDVEKLIER